MCGIAGWVDYQKDISQNSAILKNMNATLKERGPDAEGFWFSKHAALTHRRLIVIDPDGGTQPMIRHLNERKYVITYNGEIYNMSELQLKLLSLGYPLSSRSDTELILYAFMEWGITCPKHLNGIFAFSIWDEHNQELFLARDQIGVKPLFYTQRGSSFLFSSELKGILAHPDVEAELDDEGLAEILLMGPARTPGIGVFKNIRECKPGHSLLVSRNGLKDYAYWELVSNYHQDDFNTTVETVKFYFQDAVKRQLISDVPIGTMLSGGLDSSAISAYAAKVFQAEERGALHTYSVDYEGNEEHFKKNEFQPNADAPWAALMAEAIGSHHHRIELNNTDLIKAIKQALFARDLPGMTDIDASLMLFCREIKKHSTVVLSGECADEVFGGYPWFYREDMVNADTFPWANLVEQRLPFLAPDIRNRLEPLHYVETRYQEALSEVPRLSEDNAHEARMREMFYLNITRWMPTLLDRKDRMSMAHGLEVRVPFCDHHLVEYVWNIPWAMKFHGKREKGLLRYALKDLLPQEITNRKKSPYPKTHNPIYLQTMQEEVKRLVEDKNAPLFYLLDRQVVKNYIEQDLSNRHFPWFGQLMNVPALLAYWIQTNHWLEEYKVKIT